MSSDPRYVVLRRDEYETMKEETGAPDELDYVVIAPPPPAEKGQTDLGVYLAVEIAGAYFSSINSGTLGPAEIIEALHHSDEYIRPLQEVALNHLLLQHKDDGGAMIVAAGSNKPLERWIADNAERLSGYVDSIYAQAHNPGVTRGVR